MSVCLAAFAGANPRPVGGIRNGHCLLVQTSSDEEVFAHGGIYSNPQLRATKIPGPLLQFSPCHALLHAL